MFSYRDIPYVRAFSFIVDFYSFVTKRVAEKSRSSAAGACALDGSTIQQDEGTEVGAVYPSTHIVVGQNVSTGERRCVPFAWA